MLEQRPIEPVAPPPAPPDLRRDQEARATTAVVAMLARARARQRRILLTTAGLQIGAGLLAATPLILALAATVTWLGRPLAVVVLLAAAGLFAWLGILRARREARDLAATARLLMERLDSPTLRRGLLPALELGSELTSKDEVAYSRPLARAHVESVALLAARADLSRALPDRSVFRAARYFMAGAIFFLCAVALFREPMGRGLRLLAAGRQGPAPKAASAEPITGEIELTYEYPAYTRLPSRTVPNTNGEISAPRGTQVRLRTRADRELGEAFLVVGANASPLTVQGSRDLSGTLLVETPGSYRFRFATSRGQVLAEGPPIPIAVEADLRPKASIVAPMGDSEVDPKSRVTLRWDAEDDYGLSEVALLFKLPGASKAERVVLQRSGDTPRRASGDYAWDLVSPGLMAGDTIAYYVEATDNDEISGKKTGVSKTQYLKIYSEAEHHRKVVKQIEQAWEKLVTLLGDRLEEPDRKLDGRTPDKILAQSSLDTRALELGRELRELSRALQKEKSPDQLWRALLLVASGLTEKATATSDLRSSLAVRLRRGLGMDSQPVRQLAQALENEVAEEEKDVLYLEALVDQQRIQDLLALSKELAARRRDLSDLLEKYRSAPDDATRDKLLNEMARLKERMAELMQRMSELSKGISDEHFNEEAAGEMARSQEMMGSFDKIQELLYRGKVEEAMKELEKLGQMLDNLEQKLQKATKDSPGGQYSEVNQKLSDFARKLDQLEDDQKELLDHTQEVRGNYKKALEDRLKQKGPDFVEKLRKRTDDARKRLQAIENPKSFWREDDLRGAKEAVEDLDKALATKDFDQAAQSVAKALGHAQQLADDFERAAQDAQRFPAAFQEEAGEARKNARNSKASVPPLEDVQHELESLTPPPSSTMSEEDRQHMKSLAQREGQLQGEAQQLRKQMEDINKQGPLFPGEAQQMMQQAGQSMQNAQQRMEDRNPTGASAQERAALDQLGELKKGLSQKSGSGEGGGSGGVPWPWMGPGQMPGGQSGIEEPFDQEVKIPEADQFTVPPEYRKEILDAMKQGAPEKYKDQVKRYYEEIVK